MEDQKKPAIIIGAQDGAAVLVAGGTYRIVISGEQTSGAYAVIDMLVPPGGGPGPHAHAAFQESFYVLEGEVEVKTETQIYTARTGDFINIPQGGIVHCFKNKSDLPARLWCTVVPAGLEGFFLEIGKPADQEKSFSLSEPDEAEKNRLLIIAEKYGQKLFPPDYLD